MSDLARILERLRQIREADQARTRAHTADISARAAARLGTFIAGDRVFDRVTGEEGSVAVVTATHVVVPAPER